jgi:hypothetical protein
MEELFDREADSEVDSVRKKPQRQQPHPQEKQT